MINKTLAIIAGGKGSRMNYINKAFLKYQKKSFIDRIIEAGRDYKEILIIANNKNDYKEYKLKVVQDIYRNHGPIGGIHSALTNSSTGFCLCVACDMPLIDKELFNKLGSFKDNYEVLIPKVDGRLQPLCAIYNKNITKKLEESIKNDNNKLQKLIKSLNYKVIEGFDNTIFMNINTEEQYKKLGVK